MEVLQKQVHCLGTCGTTFLGSQNGPITESTKGQAVLTRLTNVDGGKFQKTGQESSYFCFLKRNLSQPCYACGARYRKLGLTYLIFNSFLSTSFLNKEHALLQHKSFIFQEYLWKRTELLFSLFILWSRCREIT